ncbi:hypothetical protein CYMTET_43771 [Cymbomonas tetramitiformis]|uniref:Uncharacterized protein n=1 Tax=Cymbomonas tetramitiformis TaxID=36881 RepID=A0AAE0C2M3_9CHLO|nr:hypothetical protein CYMTET_43771 [Cymbomonas tetramitiformis]
MTSRATSPILQGRDPRNFSAPVTPASAVFQQPCRADQYPRPQTQTPGGRLPNHNFSNERMHTLKYGQKFENFGRWQTENRKYGNDSTPVIIE